MREGDELRGAVLQGQRAEERNAQRGVQLGGVLPGEHGFGTGRRVDDVSGAQECLDHLRRHQIRVPVTVRQQRLGAEKELDGDRWRLSRCLTGGVAQPFDRLLVAPLRSEHQMIGHVQPVRAGGHQLRRGLTVQEAAGRRRHVLIDRVVHQLMPEHDPVVGLVEQLGVEGVLELPDDLGRQPAGDRGDVAKRHGIAEHRGDLQQLQRRRRQVAQAANHEVTQRGRQLEGRRLDTIPVAAQHPSVGQRAQDGHRPQRVAARLGQHRGQGGTRGGPEHPMGEHDHVVGIQRLELQGARACGRQIVEQPDHVRPQRGRPRRHHDEQRRKRQLARHGQDRQQACAVRPMKVLGNYQHRALGAYRLHQIHDLLEHPVLDVACALAS